MSLSAIHWSASPLDVVGIEARLAAGAERLATWPVTEFDTTETQCFREGAQIWIWQPDVGAVCTHLDEPRLTAWNWPGADRAWFEQVVTRSWLPAIYPLWGRQVLHASAAVHAATGDTVAFTGPTHAGKSTTAYGFSRRTGWQLLADDTVAFTLRSGPSGSKSSTRQITRSSNSPSVFLHPIAQTVRLRSASAAHYGLSHGVEQPVDWPGGTPLLRAIYLLDREEPAMGAAEFTPLRAAEALPLLLQQAYALSFGIPKYNQALMKDYLALSAAVPVFRLRYRRSFDLADELFASLERHLASEAGVGAS